MRYIQSFNTSGAVQTAIDKGTLENPYVAFIEDEQYIDWNALERDYSLEYFTVEALSAGTLSLNLGGVSYSLNDAEWVAMSAAGSISLAAGDKVRMKGSLYNSDNLLSGNSLSSNVYGNIQSLYYGDDFSAETTCKSAQYMFKNYAGLADASNLVLPATTVARTCYRYMFQGCTSLTVAPALPATTLASECYTCMFDSCTSLTAAPELPATTLAGGCYTYMFNGCTSLTTAPATLPATTLATSCYNSMFYRCTSLTVAPALPATTLVGSCYNCMFQGCTSLTVAPELPATTLATSCYSYMFKGCTRLNYIKCLATDISASYCIKYWVNSVAASGTFVKAANMTSWGSGASGIPTGWTVEDAE